MSDKFILKDVLNDYILIIKAATEMEKHADGADASVLFFSLGCANFLDVHVQTSEKHSVLQIMCS